MALYSKTVKYLRQVISAPEKKKNLKFNTLSNLNNIHVLKSKYASKDSRQRNKREARDPGKGFDEP